MDEPEFSEAFWDEHAQPLMVRDELHELLPTLDVDVFDPLRQEELRQMLDSDELARATALVARWRSEDSHLNRGAAA